MDEQLTFEFEQRPTIKGFPELRWTGKRPYRSTQYYPAQLRESYGEEQSGWINKIFWGDNLQVMSHMLRDFRGKIDLIYIDPPFDSKADYKKQIKIRRKSVYGDMSSFEEKQYGDIWTNDEYLQFMYERLIILRELLSENGSIFLHCDWHKSAYLKIIMDEVFGNGGNNAAGPGYKNEIIWQRTGAHNDAGKYGVVHDTIYWYTKSSKYYFSMEMIPLTEEHVNSRFKTVEPETGRRFYPGPITAPGDGPARIFRGKTLLPPAGRHWSYSQENIDELEKQNRIYYSSTGIPYLKEYADEYTEQGRRLQSVWTDILPSKTGNEIVGYPTQKPEKLLERIIKACSRPGDLVFDCFMGSGTTQAVAMRLGRRFIGADINLGAIQITTKRLLAIAKELEPEHKPVTYEVEPQLSMVAEEPTPYLAAASAGGNFELSAEERSKVIDFFKAKGMDTSALEEDVKYTGFEVYNVNNYDFFRNPVEARDLLIAALEIQPFPQSDVWDGELDGRMVKIMPVNRIATKADLKELLANLPYKTYEKRKEENPNQPVERITIVCMGHEPDLKGALEQELSDYKVDVQIVDILRDKKDLQLKRDSEAEIVCEGDKLVIRAFYPMNLMQKLSLHKEYVEDWRQLVDSIMIDWNYDGVVMQPTVTDVPGKNEMVKGIYDIPEGSGTIKVKITDLISESLEVEVR